LKRLEQRELKQSREIIREKGSRGDVKKMMIE
jgi:hypothetical protein